MNSILNIRWEGKMNALGLFLIVLCSSLGVTESGQTEESNANQALKWQGEKPLSNNHFVSLRRKPANDSYYGAGHVCGGSVISHTVVLTAAHCFVDRTSSNGTFLDKSNFVVVLGKKQLTTDNDKPLFFRLQEVAVLVTMLDMESYDKDIALVHLNGTVPPFIQPVQMTTDTHQPPAHCQISAWTNNQMEYSLGHLVNLNVTLSERPACQQVDLLPGMICAENANDTQLAACIPDDGGPLLCEGQLVGISTGDMRCDMPKQSGIYTSVGHYKSWIDEFVQRYDIREQRQSADSDAEADPESDAEDDMEADADRDGDDDEFDGGVDSKDLTDAIDSTKASGVVHTFNPLKFYLYVIFVWSLFRL